MTLWRQSKLDNPIRCATDYRVLTPDMEAQVSLINRRQAEETLRMELEKRAQELNQSRQHFEFYSDWKCGRRASQQWHTVTNFFGYRDHRDSERHNLL